MPPFVRDVRFALRTLAKSPAFTIAAALALAIAIGAHTAVFSVVYALLSVPMPVEDPSRVAILGSDNPEQNILRGNVSADDFLDLRDEIDSFSFLAAVTQGQFNVTGTSDPIRVTATMVTPGYFDAAGVTLDRGRGFLAEEGVRDHDKVVVVSHGFWQLSMGGSQDVVGSRLQLDGESYDVVGVAPEGFFFPNPAVGLWMPLALERGTEPRDQRTLFAVGRLRDGVTAEEASAEARAIGDRLAAAYPETNQGWSASVATLASTFRQGTEFATILLYSAITFVLLIACVNVANLVLARSLARQRELALRSSLGASRPRLVVQLLTESIVLALTGGGAGFLLGLAGVKMLRNWLAPDASVGFIAPFIRADGMVALHAMAVSALAGILFGLIPAFQVTRGDLVSVLREGGGGGESRGRYRLRGGLVMAEVALALALLVSAATLIRAFNRIYEADPGFDTSNVLTLQLALPERDYPEPQQVAQFFDEVVARLAELPGARGAAVTTAMPLTQQPGLGTARVQMEGDAVDERDRTPNVTDAVVSPSYFETLGLEIRHGRGFDARDRGESEPVAMVTELFVERFLEGSEALDRRLRLLSPVGEEPGSWLRIVGVVADHESHSHSLRQPTRLPQVFLPHEQAPRREATVAVRTSGPPLELADRARAAIWTLDRTMPIDNLRTLEQAVAQFDTQNVVFLRVLSGLAAVALVLAAVGIYGIIAYSVNQRKRELGIRVALGARPTNAVGLVARQAVRLTSAGLLAGCVIAWWLVRFMASQLVGISQTQAGGPLTYVAVIGLFVSVALAASMVPALRAVRLDPVRALRED